MSWPTAQDLAAQAERAARAEEVAVEVEAAARRARQHADEAAETAENGRLQVAYQTAFAEADEYFGGPDSAGVCHGYAEACLRYALWRFLPDEEAAR